MDMSFGINTSPENSSLSYTRGNSENQGISYLIFRAQISKSGLLHTCCQSYDKPEFVTQDFMKYSIDTTAFLK